MQRYGHTKKFAKHIVALVIKEQENETKYLADSVSNSSKVKQTLHCDNVISVIARNGRRFRKSEEPRDKDYKKRWAIEMIFARLNELFALQGTV